jgi:DNA-directed RNA polymerase subunit M/transcription elongation factor TFIIS
MRPGTDALACASCGYTGRIEAAQVQAPVVEHDFADALARLATRPAQDLVAGGREVQCQNCGARTVITKQATHCPFCDNAVVVELTSGDVTIEPQNLLPFIIDQQRASEHFQRWLRKRWFAPVGLSKRAQHDALDGVYLPYWTFDAATVTDYEGSRGDHYWDTERYTDSDGKAQTRRVQKTRWRSASGTVQLSFDDVLVCATTSLPHKVIDRLEPWDLGELKPFDGKFLAGFTAERYQIDLKQGFQFAVVRMEPRIVTAIEQDIGGDRQRISSKSTRHHDVTFKHVLLPLWVSAFRYHDKVYRVTVNARTGEVAGERPWSWGKIALLVLLILAIIALIVWAAMRR